MSKLIVVGNEGDVSPDGVLSGIPEDSELIFRPDLPSALVALRDESADGIVAPAKNLPTAPEGIPAVDPQTVLNAINEGILVVDRDLRMLWVNDAVTRGGPPKGEAEIGQPCYRHFHGRNEVCMDCEATATFATGKQAKSVHRTFDGRYVESISSPIFNDKGEVEFVVMVERDVSERVFLQSKIESIYQAGNHLAGLDWSQMSSMSLKERIEHIKHNIVMHTEKLLKFDSLLIRQLDDRTGELKPMIHVGHSEHEDEVIRETVVLAKREGYGISGYVAATGQSYLCRDAQTDPLIRHHTKEFGSQVTVPLRLNDRVVGTMAIRSSQTGHYSLEDVKLLDIFANFVAMGLNTANLIQLEHTVTHGRIAERIAHEIANPINAIMNDVYLLLQEYIGYDSNTIAKLKDIEHNIERVKEVVTSITDEEETVITTPRRAEDDVLRGKRILVADDDTAIRQTMSDVLAKEGCIVATASDGQEAMEMIDGHDPYDLILSDIKMPKQSGYDIYAHVRQKSPDTPVILMTAFGYDPHHSIVKAKLDGLETVLFKPFKVTALKSAIRKAIEEKQNSPETD